MNFFPLVLLLLFVVFLPVVFRRIQLNRFGYWLLGGYVVLLLVAVVVYSFIPKDKVAEREEVEQDNIYLVHEVMDRRVPIEEFKQYEEMEWEFDVTDEERVYLQMNTGHQYYFPAVIKRVEDQETIKLTLYEIEPDIGIEPEEDYPAYVTMQYTPGTISILPNGIRMYRYAEVTKGFPYDHFSQGTDHYFYSEPFHYDNLLYITIPEDIEFNTTPEIDAHWLN